MIDFFISQDAIRKQGPARYFVIHVQQLRFTPTDGMLPNPFCVSHNGRQLLLKHWNVREVLFHVFTPQCMLKKITVNPK
jgi:hypothetical protein